jgi:hypothetical protein
VGDINFNKMRKVSTTISTGTEITYNGMAAKVGLMRKIDDKLVIEIKVNFDPCSVITVNHSVKAINKMILNKDILI